jgi:hypothetical protein
MRCRHAFVLLFVAVACSHEADASRGGAADPLAAVGLDGGKRWRADDHTREILAKMRAAVQAAANDKSPASTKALATQMQGLGNELIGGCTMTGPAHEALHAYLGVLLPGFHRMGEDDAARAQQARGEVAVVLGRFDEFFQ